MAQIQTNSVEPFMTKVCYAGQGSEHFIQLVGKIEDKFLSSLDLAMQYIMDARKITDVVIDVSQAKMIDSIGLGLMTAFAQKLNDIGLRPKILIGPQDQTFSIFQSLGVVDYFAWQNNLDEYAGFRGFEILPQDESPEGICQRGIVAHKALIQANHGNKPEFQGILTALTMELALLKYGDGQLNISASRFPKVIKRPGLEGSGATYGIPEETFLH